ncbi:MAG: RnfH family protein [Armatimonadetes bacterium]|nr:RnfH family protein [Armatimonadota bacterium]
MRITIEVMSPLRNRLPRGQRSATLELRPGSTVADALRAAGVPDEELWNASIAGQLVYAEYQLKEGDSLLVFAPIAGGCQQA